MLSRNRTLGQILIVTIAVLGLWLGSHLHFWLGLLMFSVAAVAFVVMSHLDLRPTEQERRIGWARVRKHGKLRYVGRQVLRGAPFLLLLLTMDLVGSYQNGSTWNPRWFAALFALMVGGTVLLSLGWWHWHERKYGNVV